MIADRLVELRYLDAISDESVRLVLKKTHSTTTFSLKTGKGWRKLGACVRL